MEKARHDENRRELEKVKKRRLEREREQLERDAERTRMMRENEGSAYSQWEAKEDEFHLNQAKMRSQLRLADNRGKPIDLLAHYATNFENVENFDLQEPYHVLRGLTQEDLEDLSADITLYAQLEKGSHVDYWADISTLCLDVLNHRKTGGANSSTVSGAVKADVSKIFLGKTPSQLIALGQQIQNKIAASGTTGVDVEYWETLAVKLKVHMAHARLRDSHMQMLKRMLAELKRMQGLQQSAQRQQRAVLEQEQRRLLQGSGHQGESVFDEADLLTVDADAADAFNKKRLAERQALGPAADDQDDDAEDMDEEADLDDAKYAEERQRILEAGMRFELPLLSADSVLDAEILNPEDDQANLDEQRRRVAAEVAEAAATGEFATEWAGQQAAAAAEDLAGSLLGNPEEHPDLRPFDDSSTTLDLFRSEASKSMEEDEQAFNVDIPLQPQQFSDKYRPRKPRFFNRVHTGFDWNLYNRKHYDKENPPPKVVQGYKFNIFYPDLLDKYATPKYFLERDPTSPDFCIIRFQAGPPYEDIAFKIVKRDWEYSHRFGFRCQFQRGVFQLYFRFQRLRYRR
ncbi:cactin [Capsaspora owczarzaki ATCC 30864]|uniref:Splicing factor Cactin n=1 Tax=Capsaspora owczarzaki (strain ATCC 30864) TaxID=595528 RepID=A0A0D2WVQ3_CAPO3|nr:cactin [Capsaspora owczarzaki ATCC 30864]KJE96353.1 cactin [Capsaspora owczarzaki ATCC 30864]|eukprot:XP_004344312.2 cactin [Capsaspora owczarzaki ATCC 30864]